MKADAAAIAKSFVAYLKEEELYHLLPAIEQELEAEIFRNQDITVIAATDLAEGEKRDITKELTTKWGEHRVVFTVDPTILSGMIVRFQDNIIDLSGRHGLRELKETLTNEV